MFRRIVTSAVATLILCVSIMPMIVVHADSTNLIANPSVESANGSIPSSWSQGNWGTNTTSFSYPNNGHSGSQSLQVETTAYTDGDAKWYFTDVAVKPNTSYTYSEYYKSNVVTEIDIQYTDTSNNLSYAYLTAPAASPSIWMQTATTFTTPANVKTLTVFHVLNKVGSLQTDDFSLIDNSLLTPPSISFTSPVNASTVANMQTITVNAADANGVKSVQFLVDGATVGTPITTTPYSTLWDTTTAINGLHTLAAIVTNIAGATATSSESVTVQNTVSQSGNLIQNPSAETANGTVPASWVSNSWGTNTTSFTYLSTGHTGVHSLKTQIATYTNGAANWYYADVPVTAGQAYQFTDWYQANVDTEVDAEVTLNNGTVQYYWVGNVLTNTNWTKFSATFTTPANTKSIAIYPVLAKKGYLVTDDLSLSAYAPVGFSRPIVSVTFDDGWANQYKNAYPLLQQYKIPATYYIISGELTNQPDYMSKKQIQTLQAAGNEIGSHTVTHSDLTTLSRAKIVSEMANSQKTLQAATGVQITDFAYPYGAYNTNTLSVGKQYYQTQRSVNPGYNTKDNLNLTQLKIEEVDSNITPAQVKVWIDTAIAQKSWLILVYHEIATVPTDSTDNLYTTQPTDIAAEMQYLKGTNVTTETVHQAISEVLPQL